MITCQELKAKMQIRVKTPKKAIFIKTKYWIIWVQIAKSSSPSVSWKFNAFLTQKDTMDGRAWIKFKGKGIRRTQKDIKSTNEKCQMAWEWGTNEYFCLPCVTILWCLSWKPPKDRGKTKSTHLASKELSWLWYFGFHSLKNWTIINDYKYIYVTLWESRHLEEFSMSVSLLNNLLLKEEFIQRSGFTSEPPIVAAATFPKFLKKFGPSLLNLFALLCYVFGLFEASFLLFEISFGSVHVLDWKA